MQALVLRIYMHVYILVFVGMHACMDGWTMCNCTVSIGVMYAVVVDVQSICICITLFLHRATLVNYSVLRLVECVITSAALFI